MAKRRMSLKQRIVPGILGVGLLSTAIMAISQESDIIGIFGQEGGELYQATTEIKLDDGHSVTVIYSQGGFQYLPDTEVPSDFQSDSNVQTFVTLTNPQLSEFFIPGLFGYTAAGGPIVDQNLKVAQASQNSGAYNADRDVEKDPAISNSVLAGQAASIQIDQEFLPEHALKYYASGSSR